jgi:hypothetical protein
MPRDEALLPLPLLLGARVLDDAEHDALTWLSQALARPGRGLVWPSVSTRALGHG